VKKKRRKLRASKYKGLLRLDIFDGMAELTRGRRESSQCNSIFPPSMRARRGIRNISRSVLYFGQLFQRSTPTSNDWTKIGQSAHTS
jgi:hypothetical protein